MEEKQEEKKDEQKLNDKIKELVEKELKRLAESGIQVNNIDYYGKLVDIHKDLENEDYWTTKKEVMKMRYEGYGDGGYSEGGYGAYGRRGVPGSGRGRRRYRGPDEMMDRMQEHYGAYSESKDSANMGNYSAKEDSIKELDYMLKAVCQFIEMLDEDASPEEKQLIKKYTRKMAEM